MLVFISHQLCTSFQYSSFKMRNNCKSKSINKFTWIHSEHCWYWRYCIQNETTALILLQLLHFMHLGSKRRQRKNKKTKNTKEKHFFIVSLLRFRCSLAPVNSHSLVLVSFWHKYKWINRKQHFYKIGNNDNNNNNDHNNISLHCEKLFFFFFLF